MRVRLSPYSPYTERLKMSHNENVLALRSVLIVLGLIISALLAAFVSTDVAWRMLFTHVSVVMFFTLMLMD